MTSTRPSYHLLLRVPGARPLFGYATATVLAASLQIFALSVLVYRQTGSTLWSGCAFAAGFLPQLVGGAVFTSLADHWRPRSVLITASAVRASSALLLMWSDLPPAVAIGLVALVAVGQPVPSGVQSALVSRLFTGGYYVLGRSVFTMISSGAQLLGLAVGGALVAALGTSAVFGLAASVQLVGMLAAAVLPKNTVGGPPRGRWRPAETWQGNGELLRDPLVRHILVSWWLPVTMLVGAESLVVAYVAEMHRPTGLTGPLLAAFPAGAAVGDLVVARWLSPDRRRRSVPWLFVIVGIGLLPMAGHPGPLVAASCFGIASAAGSYQLGGQQAFLDAVPGERRGLAFGLFNTGLQAGQGVGPVLAGAVADRLGAGTMIAVLGGIVVLAAVRFGRLPAPA